MAQSESSRWLTCPFLWSAGADLFSNCTEECKALGHSDRCWMPSFVASDGRQGLDYRSNLHVPGMDSVPDTEVFESPEQMADNSFSTFGKQHQPLHHHKNHHCHLQPPPVSQCLTSERKELEAFLPRARAASNTAYFSEYSVVLPTNLVKQKDVKVHFLHGLAENVFQLWPLFS